jgi:hypothetical protein
LCRSCLIANNHTTPAPKMGKPERRDANCDLPFQISHSAPLWSPPGRLTPGTSDTHAAGVPLATNSASDPAPCSPSLLLLFSYLWAFLDTPGALNEVTAKCSDPDPASGGGRVGEYWRLEIGMSEGLPDDGASVSYYPMAKSLRSSKDHHLVFFCFSFPSSLLRFGHGSWSAAWGIACLSFHSFTDFLVLLFGRTGAALLINPEKP